MKQNQNTQDYNDKASARHKAGLPNQGFFTSPNLLSDYQQSSEHDRNRICFKK